MKKKLISFLSALTLINACAILDNNTKYGYITTNIKFPKTFNIKVIPPNTKTIAIEITGVGLTTALRYEITKEESRKVVNGVPIGSKSVLAKALDEKGVLLAQGIGLTTVEGGKNTILEITLNTVSNNTSNNITSEPTNQGTNKDSESSDSSQDSSNSSDSDSNDSTPTNNNSQNDSDTTDSDSSDESDTSDSSDDSGDSSYSGNGTFFPTRQKDIPVEINTQNGTPNSNSSISISVPSATPTPR
ncbi:MAG: hypothetical protein U0457_20520 [Candidatus Sericytochromatia bacterium]